MFPSSGVAVALALLFIVPGFLVLQTKRRLYVVAQATPFQETIAALAVSALLVGATEAVFHRQGETGFLFVDESRLSELLTNGLLWKRYLFILTVAIVVGAVWAFLLKAGLPKWLYKLGFTVGVSPTPWDELFSRDNDWLTVRFSDGSAIKGWKRYASSYPDPHELLLEKATFYSADRNKSFDIPEVWLSVDEIKVIEHARKHS